MRLVTLSVLLHGLLAWRLLPALHPWPWVQLLMAAALLASSVALPLGLMARRVRRQPLSDQLAATGYVFMGWFSSVFILSLLRDIALGVAWAVSRAWPPWQGADAFSVDTAAGVALLSLLLTLLGWWNARRTASVVEVDVPVHRLPDGLHGFTIAQITDIHVGPTIKQPYLRAIVQSVNALRADMVAITGDLVDGSVRSLAPHVSPLAELSSSHGTYFVTGNHEYYSGAHAWIAELQRLGVRVLLNEHVVLRHHGSELVVAGVTDYTAHHFDPTHKSDPHAALQGSPPHAIRLLLAHQPRSAEDASKAGFHLQVSGHTHGGQFWPWRFAVPLQQPFVAGLHRVRDMWIYISRGTGYWGPPKRVGAPSEITLLRLVRAE